LNKRVGLIATTPDSQPQWLNLQDVEVELTSEDPNWPIEGTVERGDYAASLEGVTGLELSIIPAIDGERRGCRVEGVAHR